MNDKILKTTLTARIFPDLKEAITKEAENHPSEITPSQYVETILLNRHNNNLTDSELYQQVTRLQRENFDLQEQISELQLNMDSDTLLAEIEVLNDANEELDQRLADLTSEKELLVEQNNQLNDNGLVFSAAEKATILRRITSLQTKYPDLSINQIIEASLFVTIQNEFYRVWIRRIDYYLKLQKRNSPLLTTI